MKNDADILNFALLEYLSEGSAESQRTMIGVLNMKGLLESVLRLLQKPFHVQNKNRCGPLVRLIISSLVSEVFNADIADKLVISEKTGKRQGSNILSKLHMLDRIQAAVFT